MRVIRNIAIIAALAFVVAAVPGGGNAAEAVLATISIAFLVVIGLAGYQVYRSQRLTIMSLTDAQRGILVAAIGVIVLMIAGADEMLETGLGALVWIGLIAASVVAIWRLYVESQTY
jgi:FtsH-binding integral membrane protein